MQIEGHFEAHYGQDSQVHDAGDTKEEPYQSIIYTGSVSTDPAVAPSRGHRQRVHRNRCSQVCHCQIHTQQLWGLHLFWLFDSRDDDQKVSNDRQNSWNAGRMNSFVTKSLVPQKKMHVNVCGSVHVCFDIMITTVMEVVQNPRERLTDVTGLSHNRFSKYVQVGYHWIFSLIKIQPAFN